MRGEDDANVAQHRIPNTLISPVIDSVVSAKNLYAVARQVGFENLVLLFAQGDGRCKEPDKLDS